MQNLKNSNLYFNFNTIFNLSISLSISVWPIENKELIDISTNSCYNESFEITSPVKIYRGEDKIKIEKINENNNASKDIITEEEDIIKLGEILIKDSKYYFKPNLKESYYSDFDEENIDNNKNENFSWLIYKRNKIPTNKNKYRIKEGDVIKIGREWLFIKEIYITNRTKKILKIKNKEKNTNSNFFSYHSQTNKELNINGDFNVSEYNETDEDKDEEIKREKNKFVTENEESRKYLKETIVKDKESNEKNNNNHKKDEKKEKIKICRICYLEEFDKDNNPLIKPCKCSGSMKYIHYECLLHWIKTKILLDSSSYFSNDLLSVYRLQKLECELCKSKFPDYIRHKKEIFNLLNLDKKFNEEIVLNKKGQKISRKRKDNKDNYIIFDSITPSRTENRYRFLVKFDKNNILKVGRGLETQLVLNDISVSRNHCQFKIEDDGSVSLEDNNSKFGSLVLIQKEIEILKGIDLNIQVGANYLIFRQKKKTRFFSCCDAEEFDSKNNYEKLNSFAIKYDKKNEILDESISSQDLENENKQDFKEQIKDNKETILKENNKNDFITFDQKAQFKNKRNRAKKENNNFDSTCNGSTFILKENRTQERLNMISNNINNSETDIKNIKEINANNKDSFNEKKSESIIISEGEESKSNLEKKNE